MPPKKSFPHISSGIGILENARSFVEAQLDSLMRSSASLLAHERTKEIQTFKGYRKQAEMLVEREWLVAEKLLFLQSDIAEIEWISREEGRIDIKSYRNSTGIQHDMVDDLLQKARSTGQEVIKKAIAAADDYISQRHKHIEEFHEKIGLHIKKILETIFEATSSKLQQAIKGATVSEDGMEIDDEIAEFNRLYTALITRLESDFKGHIRVADQELINAQKMRATQFAELIDKATRNHEVAFHTDAHLAFRKIMDSAVQAFEKVLRNAEMAAELVKNQAIYSHMLKMDQLEHAFQGYKSFIFLASSIFENAFRTAIAFDRERRLKEEAQSELRELRGMLHICSFCKKIRDEDGNWVPLEQYIHTRSQVDFSHGLCPECLKQNYPDFSQE
ncbi:MAG: hypothetical protein D6736_05685 [Nitrospinota bacterium]|nr:MAG: hypothetical protein D6736_05685 [Nitrospinota bacterium]